MTFWRRLLEKQNKNPQMVRLLWTFPKVEQVSLEFLRQIICYYSEAVSKKERKRLKGAPRLQAAAGRVCVEGYIDKWDEWKKVKRKKEHGSARVSWSSRIHKNHFKVIRGKKEKKLFCVSWFGIRRETMNSILETRKLCVRRSSRRKNRLFPNDSNWLWS